MAIKNVRFPQTCLCGLCSPGLFGSCVTKQQSPIWWHWQ